MSGSIVRKPSHADRWFHCSASPEWEQRFPREKSDVAREGDAMHEAVAQILNPDSPVQDLVDRQMSNGITLDDYMMSAVDSCVEYVNSFGFPQQQLVVEQYIQIDGVPYPGKPDLWHVSATTSTLDIFDFKFGYSTEEATRNKQMICYMHLIIALLGASQSIQRIRMHICQPRAWHPLGPHRTWEITMQEATQYIKELYEAAYKPAECKVGSHCRNCSAIGNCGSARQSTLAAMDIATLAVFEDMDGDALGAQLDLMVLAETLVKQRRKSLEGLAEMRLHKGELVSGWATESKLGNRQWNPDCTQEFLKKFGEGIGISLIDEKPITPAQAEARKLNENIVKKLTNRKSSPKLVKMTAEMITERMNNGRRK